MKRIIGTLAIALMFQLNAQVGINSLPPFQPGVVFDVKGGTVRFDQIPTASSYQYVVVTNDNGDVMKIPLSSIVVPPASSSTSFNQSNYVRLESIVVYGRLLLNNNITLSPTSSVIQGGDLGGSDNQLRGVVNSGNRNITLEVKKIQSGQGYVTVEVLDQTSMAIIASHNFAIQDGLPVNSSLQFSFNVNHPNKFLFNLKVSNAFKADIKFLSAS